MLKNEVAINAINHVAGDISLRFQIKTGGGSGSGGGAQILLSDCDGCDGYLIIIGGWLGGSHGWPGWSAIKHTKAGSTLSFVQVLNLGVS